MAKFCSLGWFPAVCFTTLTLFASPIARAEEDDAASILKTMTDYVASQKNISAAFDTDIEVITPELQKIQFASSSRSTGRTDVNQGNHGGLDPEFIAAIEDLRWFAG
jgi:hypothetical protein